MCSWFVWLNCLKIHLKIHLDQWCIQEEQFYASIMKSLLLWYMIVCCCLPSPVFRLIQWLGFLDNWARWMPLPAQQISRTSLERSRRSRRLRDGQWTCCGRMDSLETDPSGKTQRGWVGWDDSHLLICYRPVSSTASRQEFLEPIDATNSLANNYFLSHPPHK